MKRPCGRSERRMWNAGGWGGDSGGATRSSARPSSALQERRPKNCQDDHLEAAASTSARMGLFGPFAGGPTYEPTSRACEHRQRLQAFMGTNPPGLRDTLAFSECRVIQDLSSASSSTLG